MDQAAIARLAAFLVEAKRRTYAGLDDDATVATPVIPGSKQLDYSNGELSYRDIYFGMAFFVGQEVVTDKQQAIWSMSYAGGVSPDITDRNTFLAVYGFLRKALLRVGEDRPFRGPSQFEQGSYRYVNASEGELPEFHGAERIYLDAMPVYALRYSGGIIR
ncbi:DUF5680 domain-containing protein [Bradyrhizobium sp.]